MPRISAANKFASPIVLTRYYLDMAKTNKYQFASINNFKFTYFCIS